MSKLYLAASLWGHAIDEAKKGKPCCLDAETILATQEQITRLRALVAVKNEALRTAHREALIHGNSYLAGITESALDKE